MKKIGLILIGFLTLLAVSAWGVGDENQGFLRFPDVSKGKVVFTSEGDLWIAPLTGGTALRLTTHDGEERYAKFSPDGKWIAFSAQYDGNMDVFVIPTEGGEPKRLTYHPESEAVVDWTPDGKIMYRTLAPNGLRELNIYTVSPEGDYPALLGLDKAAMASFDASGSRVAYTRIFRNNATWKHYRGGLADQIWVADLKNKKFGKKAVSTYTGHNSYPMWMGERIYFLSDSVGRKNIWSMKADGSDQKQHTKQSKYDIRWPSGGDGIIVYQFGMDIWKYDPKNGETSKIDIKLPSERLQARTDILNPAEFINYYDLNEDGKWMVIEARGQLFTVPTKSKETVIRRLTSDFSSRAKAPFYLDNKVVSLTDAAGEDEFFQFDPFLKEKPKQLTFNNKIWRYDGYSSPDNKWIAFTDGNMALWIMEVESGKLTKVAQSEVWEIRYFAWSPDSRYLAYVNPRNGNISAINIYDIKEKQDHCVTNEMYDSYFPTWDPKGKYLYFLVESNFNPMQDNYGAQFIYYTPDKLYMYLLSPKTPNPFAPDSSLLGIVKEEEKEKEKKEGEKKEEEKKEEKKEEKVEVEIDFAGLSERMIELPISPGYYHSLRAAEGMLYYMSNDYTGMKFEGERPKPSLNLFKLENRKNYTVMTGVDNFDLSDDGKVVVVKQGPGFIRMDAGTTEAPTGTGDEDPHIKLEGWSMRHEPRQEWKQMVLEAWRIQRDFFYDPNMHGVDWPAILKLYEPLIDRISTRDELNDLIGEMIGEMNAGHAYIFGGDIPQPKQISVGLLGADISRDPKSRYFRIDKIFIPDRTNKDLTSPLALPEVNAKTGEYIIAIDGIPTNTVSNYLELLQDKAGKEVILTLNSTPQMEGSRDAIVKTISWEGELRYRDWVENRRKYVEKASGGRIGYVHLSDMSTDGLCEFGRMYYPQYQKEGMVIDVRYNGGGYIAPMLLSQLDRRVWCTEKGRRGAVDRRPYSAFYGHFAILCNEETGSDGETFTQGAKMLNLGRVFGKRTWGGWVGIRGDKFLNDRAWYTSPEFSGWGVIGAEKGKWLIEGPGVSPDETVENDPESVLAGKDPQLDTAIAYLLDKIKNEPRRLPEVPPIPYKEVNVPRR